MTKFNVPGRLISFYEGGEAYQTFSAGKPADNHALGQDEFELFTAVVSGRRVRPAKGGFYVIADLSDKALEALRYWAETLETASADEAAYDPDYRADLRAAQRVLTKLSLRR